MAVVSRAHRGRKRLAHRARDAKGPPLHYLNPIGTFPQYNMAILINIDYYNLNNKYSP